MEKNLAVGIDLGGTSIRAALVTPEGEVLKKARILTQQVASPGIFEKAVADLLLNELRIEDHEVVGIGLGAPGPMSRRERLIYQTPHLPNLSGYPIGRKIEELTGYPVVMDHDAKCAALGEWVFGASQGARDCVYLGFGTGIGGGIILNGELVYGAQDGAGELGHITLHPGGEACACGNLGCFEQYSSSKAFERRSQKYFGEEVPAKMILEKAEDSDPRAHMLLEEFCDDLSLGLGSIINIFNPELIVLGGGLFSGDDTSSEKFLSRVEKGLVGRCFESSRKSTRIRIAQLKGESGLLGAAQLVFRASKQDHDLLSDVSEI